MFARWLTQKWFQRRLSPALWLCVPLSWIYGWLADWRRSRCTPERLPVPVVVVGNLTVGGAGKTPLTLWLAQALQVRGYRPGIVSRGYGAAVDAPQQVKSDSSPDQVGDEPLLLARRSGAPVFVGRRRADAGRALLAAFPAVDVVLCDDGLQHYPLARDVELAVFDRRGAGNGWRLPAGPLREPLTRLATVDAVIGNDLPAGALPVETPFFDMRLQSGTFYRLGAPVEQCTAAALVRAGRPLYALAGIGDPARFFSTLAGLGLVCETRPFPDHHAYVAGDLAFAADGILLMTEKDAVKCAALVSAGGVAADIWVLPVDAELSPDLIDLILEKIRGRTAA